MNKVFQLIIVCCCMVAVQSCSKKVHPMPTVTDANTNVNTNTKSDTILPVLKIVDSITAIKPLVKRKPKENTPKVITVNDKYASKSVDGRYYYDLQGHRYWRSNKDGKYYLFNKSMLTDEAFKKP